eukprot:scaffold18124_cov65-Phaeocystis_antarctica.AAC.3
MLLGDASSWGAQLRGRAWVTRDLQGQCKRGLRAAEHRPSPTARPPGERTAPAESSSFATAGLRPD